MAKLKNSIYLIFLFHPSLISVSEELWLPLQYLARKKERHKWELQCGVFTFFLPILKRLCKAIKIILESKRFIASCSHLADLVLKNDNEQMANEFEKEFKNLDIWNKPGILLPYLDTEQGGFHNSTKHLWTN